MNNEIALALRLARVAMNRTQWDIARHLGIHPVHLNYLERGTRPADPVLVQRVLHELDATAPKSPLATLVLREAHRIAKKTGSSDGIGVNGEKGSTHTLITEKK